MSSGGSFSITAYRPEQNEAEDVFDRLEVDSDDESFSQPAGIPCTATGVPLTEETATKTAEAYVFSPPQDAFVALAVSGPWPQNHLDKVLLLLHHPSIDVHAAAVKELVLLTAETDKRRRQAGEARVAAFSHLTRLSMLLASEDTQVSVDAAHVLDTLFLLTTEEQASAAAAPGTIPQLVAALSSQDSCLQVAAAELLWMLTASAPASAAAAAFPSVLSKVSDILIGSESIHLQAKGIQLLWALTPYMLDRCRPADLVAVRSIISGVVDMLHHSERGFQERAAMHLAELGRCAGCLEPAAVQGVFTTLIGWLRSHDTHLQQLSLTAIKSLTCSSSEYRAAVAAVPGALNLLLGWCGLGASSSRELQVQATELLAALMKGHADGAIRAKVAAVPGCFRKLVAMLEDPSSSIQQLGAEMIGSLARHDPSVRIAFSSMSGCLARLMGMLDSGDEGVQQRAAAALSRLTIPPPDNQARLAAWPRYMPRLVELLRSENEEVQAQAALALHALAAGSRPNRVAMRNLPGCLRTLCALSRDFDRRRLQHMAVLILRWFTTNRQVRQQLLAGQLTYEAFKAALPAPAVFQPPREQPEEEDEFEEPHGYGCYHSGWLADGEDTLWFASAWMALKAGIQRRTKSHMPHRSRGYAHRISSDIHAALPGC